MTSTADCGRWQSAHAARLEPAVATSKKRTAAKAVAAMIVLRGDTERPAVGVGSSSPSLSALAKEVLSVVPPSLTKADPYVREAAPAGP